jgi:hypothetical protein
VKPPQQRTGPALVDGHSGRRTVQGIQIVEQRFRPAETIVSAIVAALASVSPWTGLPMSQRPRLADEGAGEKRLLGRVSKARVSREMLRSWDEAT